jgi:hypothetical protein
MIIEYLATDKGFVKKIILNNVLNSHNDMLIFYVTFIEKAYLMADEGDTEIVDNAYLMSDDGQTLFDIDPDLKEPTKDIDKIIKKYGLESENGEIFFYTTKDELEEKELMFAKALTEIAGVK